MEEIIFYDSGIGGISLLNKARSILPKERFVYFADNLNVPYGNRSTEELKKLTKANLKKVISETTKAVVIACNTITSTVIEELRKSFPGVKILGIEPEVKTPLRYNLKNILLIGTKRTIEAVSDKYPEQVTKLVADNLAKNIEENIFDKEKILWEIEKIKSTSKLPYDAIVLGCTHYALVKDVFRYVFSDKIYIFDGTTGTIKNLSKSIKKEKTGFGSVKLILTKENINERMKYIKLIQ